MLPEITDLLESLPFHAAVLDAEGCVVAANASYTRLIHDLDPEAAPDDTFAFFCAKTMTEPTTAAVRRGLESVIAGTSPRYEMDLPSGPTQAPVWHSLCLMPLHGPLQAAGAAPAQTCPGHAI